MTATREAGFGQNGVRDSGNVNGIRDLIATREAGFGQNRVRDSGHVNGIRDLTATRDPGFAKNSSVILTSFVSTAIRL